MCRTCVRPRALHIYMLSSVTTAFISLLSSRWWRPVDREWYCLEGASRPWDWVLTLWQVGSFYLSLGKVYEVNLVEQTYGKNHQLKPFDIYTHCVDFYLFLVVLSDRNVVFEVRERTSAQSHQSLKPDDGELRFTQKLGGLIWWQKSIVINESLITTF